MTELTKLAEQQKNQRALQIKNKFLKQTHYGKIAETVTSVIKKLNKTTEIFK